MNFYAVIEQIHHELADRQISVAAMARELGLPQRTLAHVLDGDRGIGGRTIARIMDRRPEWWPLLNGSNNHSRVSDQRKEHGPGATG